MCFQLEVTRARLCMVSFNKNKGGHGIFASGLLEVSGGHRINGGWNVA